MDNFGGEQHVDWFGDYFYQLGGKDKFAAL